VSIILFFSLRQESERGERGREGERERERERKREKKRKKERLQHLSRSLRESANRVPVTELARARREKTGEEESLRVRLIGEDLISMISR